MSDHLNWDTDGAAWPHREASRFVPSAGLRWHVQVLGQGPVLWLLHGAGAAGMSWRGLVPLLAPHFTLVVPDLPGHGFSGALPAARQSLAGMAGALQALSQGLELPPEALLGHSAGAALAARSVLDGFWQPRLLVGVNAALLPFGGPANPLLAGIARWLARTGPVPWLLSRHTGQAGAARRLVASTGSRLDDQGLALYAALLRSPAHLRGALAMMGDWDLDALWHALPRLVPPLQLLVGEADLSVSPGQADKTARHCPGTRVHRRAGLGHLAHEEAPQWVANEVRGAWGGASAANQQDTAVTG